MSNNFAVFILTHGRAGNVITFDTLRRQGYTGQIYIIIDNEDRSINEYRQKFGDAVIVFDKLAISKTFDTGDNFTDRRAVIYARNACWGIAESLGIEYFLQLDDDYTKFEYRINGDGQYPSDHWIVQNGLDDIFDLYVDYYKSVDAQSIAMAQGGDFFGGSVGFGKPKRKCMNTFFCAVSRPFNFVGRINEDVNTYTWFQSLGNLFLTVPFVSITQVQTQEGAGGMTDLYLDSGTYVKSFYTVMYAPSCTTIAPMGSAHKRLHHKINWKCAVPCIVEEKYRKADHTGLSPELTDADSGA